MTKQSEQDAEEPKETYMALRDLMRVMYNHANEQRYVMATVSTIYWIRRGRGWPAGRPRSTMVFIREYLPMLEAMGCIEIHRLWDEGKGVLDYKSGDPKSYIPIIELKDELTEEKWATYLAQVAEGNRQAQIGKLEQELAQLRGK